MSRPTRTESLGPRSREAHDASLRRSVGAGDEIDDRHNQVIFRVRPDATKKDVKKAVELMWKDKKIEVASVQIVNVHGKKKRFGAYTGRRRNWKKAYVSLKPGQEINFAQEA